MRSLEHKLRRILYRLAINFIPRNRLGDKLLSYITFVYSHRRLPKNQHVFNDVLFKIKTTDEILDPIRLFVADKELVKLFVRALVGDKYNVPTLKVFYSSSELDDFIFPDSCCIKPTHASGIVILKNMEDNVDMERVKSWFKINYYRTHRGIEYKNLKPKVIVEPLLFGGNNLEDYKFFCYKGAPKLIQVDIDRHINHTRKYFDKDWNELDFSILYPISPRMLDKPSNLEEMLFVAESLAKYFDFIRIDLYSDGSNVYVGEITNCHGGATEEFIPKSAEIYASKLIFGD